MCPAPFSLIAGRAQAARPVSVPPYLLPGGRDLRLDLMRGFCVFAMITDHVGDTSPLRLLTGSNRFLTSAAEGFILISGFTAGLVYRSLIARLGYEAAVKKALRRAFSLYLIAVSLVFLLMPVSETFQLPWAQGLTIEHSVSFVLGVLTLHRGYSLADIMLIYTFLLAFMPLALLLLNSGRTRLLVVTSAGLWALHRFAPALATITWPIAGNEAFDLAAWQLLFFVALALGYHRDRLPVLTPATLRRVQLLTGAGVFALLVFFAICLPPESFPQRLHALSPFSDAQQTWIMARLADKPGLGPLRLVATAVCYTFFFVTLTRGWNWLHRPLNALLLPYGQNALYAYTAHIPFAVAAALIIRALGPAGYNFWLNGVFQLIALAAIWLLARRKFLLPTPQTRRYWELVPFALAVLTLIGLP